MSALLEVRDLNVVFDTDEGPLTAVEEVSFSLEPGESVGLVGESGCGKSVTAQSLLRLIPRPPGRIVSGSIRFRGRDVLALPAGELHGLRGAGIGMIFQEPGAALSPLHAIGAQLVEAQRLHATLSRQAAWARGQEWLARVGIPDPATIMAAFPFELSGGMLQRVMIAMTLMLAPALVVADEPTTALDMTLQAQVLDLLREQLARDQALLLITHDLGVIWEMCERVIVMYASRIVEEGPRRAVFERPAHPYTEALLRSVMSLNGREERLVAIPGQVPSPLAYPAGCRFAPRCPHAADRCRRETPPDYPAGEGRRAACFLRERGAP
jgi:peptide/nickel transport system ATP-binding protein/oligopeptide transport system ATP-binding protein